MIVLHLSTLDTTLLIIVAVALSLYFILGSALIIALLLLVKKMKQLALKAEEAIESVEEATTTIKNIGSQASGPLALIKVIKAVADLFNKDKK